MGPAQTAKQKGSPKRFSGLRTRVISGVVLIALVLLAIWLRGPLLMVVVGAAAALGAHEVYTMAWRAGYRPWYAGGVALSLLLALRAYLAWPDLLTGAATAVPGTGIEAVMVGAVLLFAMARQSVQRERARGDLSGAEKGHDGWVDLGMMLAGAVYTGGLLGLAPLIAAIPGSPGKGDGAAWLLLVLVGTAACDTGAYFVGSLTGRHKMAPQISPGKTWEGFAGGMLGAIIAALALAPLLGLQPGAAVVLGLLICGAAVAGDLSESLLKRASGVKDSGTLIPGHGGILDRIDSVLFVLAVVYVFTRF